MAYHRTKRKFGRKKNQRLALMKSLAYSLTLKEKIKTTEAKAKSLRPYIEKLVTLRKKDNQAMHRLLEARVGTRAAKKIATELSPRYKKRAGGYTRITKMARRASDGAKQAIIEFV
ncbi:MAG: 50S ribosomal protein L17 [Candidatus Zambryskibacteria bacterium]|nr:50S ribosomal protein L17 [Candidatus Zambryskibacteria bacterium]